jgi:hypothetical protein
LQRHLARFADTGANSDEDHRKACEDADGVVHELSIGLSVRPEETPR